MSRFLLMAGFLGGIISAQAQNAPVFPLSQASAPELVPRVLHKSAVVRLQNLPPKMAAHWLDPANHPSGELEENARRSWLANGHSRETFAPLAPPVPVSLPLGIRELRPVDNQNSLLVVGATDAVNEVVATIKQLDVPLKQIEMECFIVALSSKALEDLKIDFQPAGATIRKDKLWMGKTESNWQKKITALVSDGKAQAITRPQIVAVEGLPATISMGVAKPAVIGLKSAQGWQPQFDAEQADAVEKPELFESFGATFTAKTNAENTINADFRLFRHRTLQFKSTAPAKEGADKSTIDSHLLQRLDGFACSLSGVDGQTFAITGFEPTLIFERGNPMLSKIKGKSVVAFVTLRRIWRLQDNETIPGV